MRTAEDLTAIILIGDGAAERPALTRAAALVEAAVGVRLAIRLARR